MQLCGRTACPVGEPFTLTTQCGSSAMRATSIALSLLLAGCTEVTVKLEDSCVNVYLQAELALDDMEQVPLAEGINAAVRIEPGARPGVVLK